MKIDRLIGILSIPLPELSNEKVFPAKGRVKAVFDPSMKWQLVEEYGVENGATSMLEPEPEP